MCHRVARHLHLRDHRGVTTAALDPLAHVLGRLQRVLGVGALAEDTAVAVAHRFVTADEPAWLRGRPEAVRLDVLTVCAVLAGRRAR